MTGTKAKAVTRGPGAVAPGSIPSLAVRRGQKDANAGSRPASIKFPEIDFACLEAFAWWHLVNVADIVRIALDEYFEIRRRDPDLPKQIAAAKRRQAEVLGAIELNNEDAAALPMPPLQNRQHTEAVKPLTVRLGVHYINKLTSLALIDGSDTIADQVRKGVDTYLTNHLTVDRLTFVSMFEDSGARGQVGEYIHGPREQASRKRRAHS